MKDKELEGIIGEIEAMLRRDGAALSPDEAAKVDQRLDEIEAIIREKTAALPPYIQVLFDAIKRGNNEK